MSSKGFGKRLGFKRSNTNQDPITVTEIGQEDGGAASSSKMVADYGDAHEIIEGVVREIPEVEANHRLNVFRQDHKYVLSPF
jgi:hypothetical protein